MQCLYTASERTSAALHERLLRMQDIGLDDMATASQPATSCLDTER
jgi:hypothetical protein